MAPAATVSLLDAAWVCPGSQQYQFADVGGLTSCDGRNFRFKTGVLPVLAGCALAGIAFHFACPS
jgi:hypothetical protein